MDDLVQAEDPSSSVLLFLRCIATRYGYNLRRVDEVQAADVQRLIVNSVGGEKLFLIEELLAELTRDVVDLGLFEVFLIIQVFIVIVNYEKAGVEVEYFEGLAVVLLDLSLFNVFGVYDALHVELRE